MARQKYGVRDYTGPLRFTFFCDLFQPILLSWHTSMDRLEFCSCAIASSLLPQLSRSSVWKEKQACLKEGTADGMMIKRIDKGKLQVLHCCVNSDNPVAVLSHGRVGKKLTLLF